MSSLVLIGRGYNRGGSLASRLVAPPLRVPSIHRRQVFEKAQRKSQLSSKKKTAVTPYQGVGAKPTQFGPQNTTWGRSIADLGPVPRTFYLRHESTILKPRVSGESAWFGLLSFTGANLIVFGMWNAPDQDEQWMMNNFATDITNTWARPWSLGTASISHENFMHLFGNMFAMWLFGFNTYRVIGGMQFAKLYAIGGLACSATHVLHNYVTGKTQPPLSMAEREQLQQMAEAGGIQTAEDLPPQVRDRMEHADQPSLGASGSVMAISAVAAALFPLDNVRMGARSFYMPLPVAVGLFVASDLAGLTQEGDPTDHAGHLGGLAAGALYAYTSWYSGRLGGAGQLPLIYRFKQLMQKK